MHSKLLLPVLFLTLLASGCKKDPGIDEMSIPNGVDITLSGSVVGPEGVFLANASIEFNGQMATTDAQGLFRMQSVAASNGRNFLKVHKSGYFFGGRNFYVDGSGEYRIQVKLLEKVLIGTIDASSGGTVSTTEGFSVDLPANAIAGGYSGTVNVYGHYLDPSRTETMLEVPGMEAVNANDEEGILLSFGMGHIVLEDDNGTELQLETGMNAELTVPVPSDLIADANPTIPLWYFDEEQGVWIEDGEAELQGSSYVGPVSHFTIWNCDDFSCSYWAKIQCVCPETDLSGLTVMLEGVNFSAPTSTSVTSADGTIYVALPCYAEVTAIVLIPATETIHHPIGTIITGQEEDGHEIALNTACPVFTTVTGCVEDGNGNPVTNGYVYLEIDDYRGEVAYCDANGCFTTSMFDFDGNSGDARLYAWNLDDFSFAQGPDIPFNDQVNVLTDPITIGGGGGSTTADGKIYVGSQDDSFYCLDASNGDLVWSYATDGFFGAVSAAYWDNRVYAGNSEGSFYCFNALDGSVIWSTQLGDWVNPPYVDNGIVYVSSSNGYIRAFDGISGVEQWSYYSGSNNLTSAPTIDGNILYCGNSSGNQLLAIEKTTGDLLWEHTTMAEVQSSPCVADGRVFVASYDQNIYAVDAISGQQLWQTLVDTDDWFYSDPTERNGMVFQKSDNFINALDTDDGSIVWQYEHNSGLASDVQVSDTRLYSFFPGGVGDRYLRCFDLQTGTVLWEEVINYVPHDILEVNGVLFHHDNEDPKPMIARDGITGQVLWTSNVASTMSGAPVLVDEFGVAHYCTKSGMQQ